MYPAAHVEVRPRPQLLLQRLADQVDEEQLEHAGPHAVRCHRLVPGPHERQRPLRPLVLRLQLQHPRHQLPRRQRQQVPLHAPEVRDGQLLFLPQHFDDALLAGAIRRVCAQEVGVIVVRDLVVGRRNPVCGRIEYRGQLIEGYPPRPLVLAGPAGHGHDPVALRPYRHQPTQLVADVPLHVGVDEVLRGR